MSTIEAIGTTRTPDGARTGEIDGLVIRQHGLLVIIDRDEVKRRAAQDVFAARIPGTREPAEIEVLHAHDRRILLRTNRSGRDELGILPIWDRQRACWVNPLGSGETGPLNGPGYDP